MDPGRRDPRGRGIPGGRLDREGLAFASLAGDRVAAYQILDRRPTTTRRASSLPPEAGGHHPPAARPGTPIVSGSIDAADGAWAARLFAGDTAPYVDVLAARGRLRAKAGGGDARSLRPERRPLGRRHRHWRDRRAGQAPEGSEPIPERRCRSRARLLRFGGGRRRARPLLARCRRGARIGELLTRLRALFPPGMGPATTARPAVRSERPGRDPRLLPHGGA